MQSVMLTLPMTLALASLCKVFYDGLSMILYDGPGCNSKEDTYAHSYVLRHGLTNEPLSGVFVTLEYNPRIRNNMGGDFYEVAKILKEDAFDLIVVLVTKMEQFYPDPQFPTRQSMEEHIRSCFKRDYGMDRVVFSDRNSTAPQLFHAMRKAIGHCRKLQLSYTDEEFLEHFDLKAWKGREQFDLHRLKKQIEKLCFEFEEGLNHLVATRQKLSDQDFQDYIYAIIQQNRLELEEQVYQPFLHRNGEDQIAFEDYTASIELQKLIHHAHSDFRNEAKKYLTVNPDNTGDWRNAIRRCQHCREVWVKVEGCDGNTTCGARPSGSDSFSTSYFRLMWERVEGKLIPAKYLMRAKPQMTQMTKPKVDLNIRRVGCGGSIVWRDQAVVPKSELDCLFSTQELENILSSFKMDRQFQQLRRRKERKIHVFAELDETGRDKKMQYAKDEDGAEELDDPEGRTSFVTP
ncbi:unnamed protein product [Durusdinium trenchii]|uniref:AIG1-type G domain-containing protein n=2 Tax=Durusdinium trenchii TaxID=1381693 RepID=A0ABP0IR32_9DINO